MRQIIDIFIALLLTIILTPLMLLIAISIKSLSPGPVLFWSKRVGKNGKIFLMPKFRTMDSNAPIVATHLLKNPNEYVSKIGAFLRKYSLDELPQLISVLFGKMAFVGPRPALYNQYDLIKMRKDKKIDEILPGITGLAQVNGRDSLSIAQKVYYDEEYARNQSLFLDFLIILKTLISVFRKKGISH